MNINYQCCYTRVNYDPELKGHSVIINAVEDLNKLRLPEHYFKSIQTAFTPQINLKEKTVIALYFEACDGDAYVGCTKAHLKETEILLDVIPFSRYGGGHCMAGRRRRRRTRGHALPVPCARHGPADAIRVVRGQGTGRA